MSDKKELKNTIIAILLIILTSVMFFELFKIYYWGVKALNYGEWCHIIPAYFFFLILFYFNHTTSTMERFLYDAEYEARYWKEKYCEKCAEHGEYEEYMNYTENEDGGSI